MGKDRKKIQKKKVQKAAKQRAKKSHRKKEHGGRAPLAIRGTLQAPVYQCWEPIGFFGGVPGIGPVIITRKAEHHRILMAVFLVDIFCLGVKDAFIRLLSEEEYRQHIKLTKNQQPLKKISPERARKLVEGAEAYAGQFGLKPHKDYQAAKKIFGDIDVSACPDTFEFGHNGKPFYVAGPYDTPAFQRRVMKALQESTGPEGSDFILPVGDIPPDSFD